MKKFLFVVVFFILIISGCNLITAKQNQPQTNQTPAPSETTISFLISTEDKLKYCDGANMDSEGYRKTINKETIGFIPETNLTREELIKKTILIANEVSGLNFAQAQGQKENYIKIINDAAYIQPTDGYAGVSIALCSWQPFVEVNLLRFPEIKNVVWVNDWPNWNELK